MMRVSAMPSEAGTKRISQAAASPLPLGAAGISARFEPTHSDDRSGDTRCRVISGLLAKRGDSPGVVIVADEARRFSSSIFRDSAGTAVEFDLGGLTRTATAVFRNHPHINNVMTHICRGRWERIEQALGIILNPLATLNDLSPLAQNIVELICAERGTTGRILKPYFHALLARVLPPRTAAYLRAHVSRLFLEMKARDALHAWHAARPDIA